MWRRLGLVIVAITAAFVITGAGYHEPETNGPENAAAADAVAALTGVTDMTPDTAFPDDFADVMGYQPDIVTDSAGETHLVNPDGDCSHIGATAYDFDRACKTHDVGYDVLRYAASAGGELGPWARRAIDTHFDDELAAQCDAVDGGAGCRTLAWAAGTAVKANSWRQGQGVPVSEEPLPYLAAGALIASAVAVPPVVARFHRRTRQAEPAEVRSLAVTA